MDREAAVAGGEVHGGVAGAVRVVRRRARVEEDLTNSRELVAPGAIILR